MLVMILSLEKDKERFKTATTALDSFNIPWVKVNAVYGKEVKREQPAYRCRRLRLYGAKARRRRQYR